MAQTLLECCKRNPADCLELVRDILRFARGPEKGRRQTLVRRVVGQLSLIEFYIDVVQEERDDTGMIVWQTTCTIKGVVDMDESFESREAFVEELMCRVHRADRKWKHLGKSELTNAQREAMFYPRERKGSDERQD